MCDPYSEFQSVIAGVFRILENDPDMGRPPKSAFLQVTPEPLTDNADNGEGRTHHHELEGGIDLGTKKHVFVQERLR
jgi:hypothetical protein